MIKFSRTDLQILLAVNSGYDNVQDIAQMLNMSSPRISSASSQLASYGFLEKKGRGPSMKLDFSNNVFIHNLKQIFNMNLQVDKIFSGSGMIFLMALIVPDMSESDDRQTSPGLTRNDIHRLSGLSFRTIDRVKKQLISAAVIFERENRIRISLPLKELRDFLTNYSQFHAGVILKNISTTADISPNGIILKFVAGGEIILASFDELTTMEELSISPTAITAMSHDQIQFLSNQYYYHYSFGKRELMKEDYIIDTLLMGSSSARNIAYALLYLQNISKHLDTKYLDEMGSLYGISNILKEMQRYLEAYPNVGNHMPKHFPRIDEFRELCELYGVALHDG